MNEARDPDTPERPPIARAPHEVLPGTLPNRYTPQAIGRAIRRRLRLFLAVLAGALVIAGLGLLLLPPRYTAVAEVVLDTSGGAIGRAPVDGESRAAAEMRIVGSREMAAAVAAALRLDGSLLGQRGSAGGLDRQIVDRLERDLSVEQLPGTYSLAIGYTARDPRLAARIANEYAAQYSSGRLAGTAPAASPLDRPYARIISRAEPPLSPSWPRPLPVLALALLAGLIGGAVAAVVAERSFAGVTSGGEIQARLGLPYLGSVPTLKSVLPEASSPLDAVVSAPMSGFAEAFRGVMMAIRHAGGRGTQVIAISSALPNEGKTTVAACLARSVALGGDAVVLIDCDARRRDSSAAFGLTDRRPGLIEVLRYEATLDEALVRDAESGAWILPLTGPAAEISDLLAGPAMVALIEDLRRRFKRILIDTAPILAISTTRAIATMADLLVMVVRWRVTADHAVLAALRLLPGEHVRIGGVVLAQVDVHRQVKIGHGDPTFYYKQYSKYYS